MANTDDYVRVAVQSRMQQDVEKSVYEKIKSELRAWKFLGIGGGVIGGIVVALLLAFHKPVFSLIVARGGEEFKNEIKAQFEKDAKEYKKVVETDIKADLKEVERLLVELKTRTTLAKEEIGKLRDEVNRQYGDITKIVEDIRRTRSDLIEEKAQLDALLDRQKGSEEAIILANDRATSALEKLGQARKDTDEIIKQYNTIVAELKASNAIAPTVKAIAQDETLIASEKRRVTVYFQFAGFKREDAVAISKTISDKGWTIPGAERVGAAVNTNKIRFNPADKQAAMFLLSDANAALQSLRRNIVLEPEPNSSIKPGIPEIWIFQR
jgi:hypothetical protein